MSKSKRLQAVIAVRLGIVISGISLDMSIEKYLPLLTTMSSSAVATVVLTGFCDSPNRKIIIEKIESTYIPST